MNTINRLCRHKNAQPVLHEIRHALDKLIHSQETTTIDLHALPMTKLDIDEVLEVLGRGEIFITINSLGKSEIWETQFPGVWITKHHPYYTNNSIYFVEISPSPKLLTVCKEDLTIGYTQLAEKLMNKPEIQVA